MNAPYLLIADKGRELLHPSPLYQVITPQDYVAADKKPDRRHKIINLCSDFDYLKTGYYCSLLAEARGQRCVPAASDIIQLHWKRMYHSSLLELSEVLNEHYPATENSPLKETHLVCFGRMMHKDMEPFGRRLFDRFRFPVMAVSLVRQRKGWHIESIEPQAFHTLLPKQMELLHASLAEFTGGKWQKSGKADKKEKYWLAILHDPKEAMPPSNTAALRKFVSVGKKLGFYVELITRKDMASLLEFDALFIRETTLIQKASYRMARKAEEEGIPCIDDTSSILRCSNKVFLHELFRAHKIPTPPTALLYRKQKLQLPAGFQYPVVVKIPDGSFSRGVHKLENDADLQQVCKKLFATSEMLLLQKFVPSEFDWRIVVLGGKALVACQYFMAPNHWQILNHQSDKKSQKYGDFRTFAIEDTPKAVVDVAVKAASLVGNGLYGVDMKQFGQQLYVIEVNDNPNLDAGVEDAVLGDALYERILQHFVRLIES